MSKQKTRRNFEQEAASEVEQIVKSNPDQSWRDLYDIAVMSSHAIVEWIDAHLEQARRKTFCSLMRYSTAETADGQKVRLLQSYTKFVQTDEGEEKQLRLWSHLDLMCRGDTQLTLNDQDANAKRCIASRNAIAAYWNQRHPNEEPLQLRFDYSN